MTETNYEMCARAQVSKSTLALNWLHVDQVFMKEGLEGHGRSFCYIDGDSHHSSCTLVHVLYIDINELDGGMCLQKTCTHLLNSCSSTASPT